MIEPRAIAGSNGDTFKLHRKLPEGTPLTTVADVLAVLREVSRDMNEAGGRVGDYPWDGNRPTRIFLAMLDQFERDQGSAT